MTDMADHAKMADKKEIYTKPNFKPKGPYGIMKIPGEERTAYGVTVAGDTIIEVIKRKLAQPLASIDLIAEQTGLSRTTVSTAMATPWCRKQLAGIQEDARTMASELYKGQGDSITFWNKSVVRGVAELEKPSQYVNPAILLNAREATRDISKGTGLHKDTLRIEQHTTSAQDYEQLDDLAQDTDIAQFLSIDTDATIYNEEEGESPTTPLSDEGGTIPLDQNPVESCGNSSRKATDNAENGAELNQLPSQST